MTSYFAVSHLADMSSLEVHRLYKLRVDVFVHEQRVPYAEIEDVDAAPTTFHVQALRKGEAGPQLLGTTRLYPTEHEGAPAYQLGRVCLRPEERGTGLSEELMRQTLRLAFEQDADRPIILDAQVPLIEFYTQFGFEPYGEVFDDCGVAHQSMIRAAEHPSA